MALGWLVGGFPEDESVGAAAAASSSDEESLSSPKAEGPLCAALRNVRNGGVPLLANDLADLKFIYTYSQHNIFLIIN